jgi:hypothetical protein
MHLGFKVADMTDTTALNPMPFAPGTRIRTKAEIDIPGMPTVPAGATGTVVNVEPTEFPQVPYLVIADLDEYLPQPGTRWGFSPSIIEPLSPFPVGAAPTLGEWGPSADEPIPYTFSEGARQSIQNLNDVPPGVPIFYEGGKQGHMINGGPVVSAEAFADAVAANQEAVAEDRGLPNGHPQLIAAYQAGALDALDALRAHLGEEARLARAASGMMPGIADRFSGYLEALDSVGTMIECVATHG